MTSHFEWVQFGKPESPPTSLWIKVNGVDGFYWVLEKKVHWCYASSQNSHWKLVVLFEYVDGNKCFIYWKLWWSILKFHNISSLSLETNIESQIIFWQCLFTLV